MSGKRPKVMLVDDSATILMMEKMLLGHEPIDLVVATNGEEAVQKAMQERPDLIVLDVIMPKMTGFEVCERLRSEPSTKETPILLVTTRGEPENVAKGWSVGCTDYITKPINNVEFLEKVREHLPR